MSAIYDKLGLRFQYPENWMLEESEADRDSTPGDGDAGDSISVYSPGGAFWSVVRSPASADTDALVEAALRAMRAEYDNLDAAAVEEVVAGRETRGYDVNFYCLDLTNSAMIRAARTPQAMLLILCQADDREFAQVENVFRAITASLLSHLA